MIALAPIFAAPNDVMQVILGAIVLIIIGAAKLYGAIQEAKEEARQAARRKLAQQQEREKAHQPKRMIERQPSGEALEVAEEDEVDTFLRQAQERKQHRPKSERQHRPKPAVSEAAAATTPATTTIKPIGAEVGEHVQKYLSTDEISQRTSRLGGEVAAADTTVDQRLHQVFDHQVSQLAAVPGEAAKPPTAVGPTELTGEVPSEEAASLAYDVVNLLSNPETLSQAIVLNEILHRPEERWA